MKYGLFGKFVAQSGKRDELLEILLQAAELLKKNEKCFLYTVGKNDNPNEVLVYEVWENKEAHDVSLEPENIRTLIMTAKPFIADMPAGVEFQALGGKGL